MEKVRYYGLYLSGEGLLFNLLDLYKNEPNVIFYLPYPNDLEFDLLGENSDYIWYVLGGGELVLNSNDNLLPNPNDGALLLLVDGKSYDAYVALWLI